MLLDLPNNNPTNQLAIQPTNQLLLNKHVLHHAMIKLEARTPPLHPSTLSRPLHHNQLLLARLLQPTALPHPLLCNRNRDCVPVLLIKHHLAHAPACLAIIATLTRPSHCRDTAVPHLCSAL
jgi:hypothetical protein